ncbi:MAG: CopD family protein [Gammaproteobacteria bacterium]|jgi:putative membrane protein|nr:TIGR00701 family protein [Gammaproteobacteria bacterium]MDP6098124.1 CopD family protein [Gammaproteobacteria bacterium]HJO12565.1 CopD family protein [Gammaproteobacteria bacterium]|tara:strand:- start:47 stop:466 length:420 start_codon:yes stop_codon:yes gene_type:complete
MLWIKAFHIVFVVCWFAGLFYLPRLFVYHAMSEDQTSKDRFIIMARKLFWGITTPSAVATVALGAWLVLDNGQYFLAFWWMHAKLALVAILLIYHGACWWFMKGLREETQNYSHVFFRFFNEFPVFLLAGIVILIVVKP